MADSLAILGADPWTVFCDRRRDDWLLGYDPQRFNDTVERAIAELEHWQTTHRDRAAPVVWLATPHPIEFWAKFLAACLVPCHVFLLNSHWRTTEWAQLSHLAQPDVIWGEIPRFPGAIAPSPLPDLPSALVMIPTGGSSGQLRFAMHTWGTLLASVQGFQQYFQVEAVHSFCVLPPYHVSGLMQFLRSLLTGGQLQCLAAKSLTQSPLPSIPPNHFFLSLVPTQLHTLLQQRDRREWLTRFHTVMLGGAPLSDRLRQIALQADIAIAPTYGMTETAAQVVTLKPAACRQGQLGCGRVLPHATVTLQNPTFDPALGYPVGQIAIAATSLALGYYPHRFPTATFQTDDLGFWDEHGSLHLVGRNSHKIITGGENVFPAEVETAIHSTGLVQDVGVTSVADRHWGQAVTALYLPAANAPTDLLAQLQAQLRDRLAAYKLPKHWIAVPHLPRNAQGKLNRLALKQLAQTQLAPNPPATGAATVANNPVTPPLAESSHEYTHDESSPD